VSDPTTLARPDQTELRKSVMSRRSSVCGREPTHGARRAPCAIQCGGDQSVGRGIDEDVDPICDPHPAEHIDGIDAVTCQKIGRSAARKAGLEDVGDQLRLDGERAFTLMHKAVAEWVEVHDPRHEDHDRQQVEHDDLARKRRTIERKHAPPLPCRAKFGLDRSGGTVPVFAEDDVGPVARAPVGHGQICRHAR
jgi:hypothetical protein